MKRAIGVGWGVWCAVLISCSVPKTPISTEARDNAQLMRAYLEVADLPVVVKVKDVDSNGGPDLLITYLPEKERWDDEERRRALAAITVSIWEIDHAGQLQTDKVFFFVRDEIWSASAPNLVECEQFEGEVRATCIQDSWSPNNRSKFGL